MLDDNPTIPVVHLDPTPTPRDKSLRTNHSCALCDVYGHYSHHCPDLPEFRLALFDMNNPELETAPLIIEEIHSPVSSPSEEVNTTLFEINNLDLEMARLTIKEIHFPVSPPSGKVNPVLFEMNHLDLEKTSPTIVEIHPPNSPSFEEINTIYMISSVTTTPSIDLTTQTFCTDEEILEALTAPDYPWDDMHHRSYFLPDESSSNTATQFTVESKDFLPPKVD